MSKLQPVVSELPLHGFAEEFRTAIGGEALSQNELNRYLLSFLAAGELTAHVHLKIAALPDEEVGEEDDDLLGDDDDARGEVNGTWLVSPAHWNLENPSALKTGRSHFSAEHLISSGFPRTALAAVRPDLRNLTDVVVFVARPAAQLKRALQSLPREEDFSGRLKYHLPQLYEVTAFCWRYLAFNSGAGGRGLNSRLLDAAREYLTHQGLSLPSDRTLENLVRHIVRQWREKNNSAAMWVSTKDDRPT